MCGFALTFKELEMKKLVHSLVLCGLVSGSAVAMAEDSPHSLTANVGLYSQYVFRGQTQTNEDPALQGGIDYAHASGFYVGMWGSNISWLADDDVYDSSSLEVDFYGGFRGPIGKSDFSYDVGLLQYWYPGDVATGFEDADTLEGYVALNWKFLGAKASYSFTDLFGIPDSDGSTYIDLYANYPIGETGLTVGAHYGWANVENGTDVDDWKVSMTYDLGKASNVLKGTTLGVAYTDNDLDNGSVYAEDQVTVWIARAF
jgi:uncharacterized protein (TIGR02001 family)